MLFVNKTLLGYAVLKVVTVVVSITFPELYKVIIIMKKEILGLFVAIQAYILYLSHYQTVSFHK